MHRLKKMVDCRLLGSSRDCYCIHPPRKPLKVHKKRAKSLNTLILLHEYLQRMSTTLASRKVMGTTCSLTSASSSSISAFCIAALHSASSSSESIGAAVHRSVASSTTSSTRSPTSGNCSSRAASSLSTASSGPVATTAAGRILAWFQQFLTVFSQLFTDKSSQAVRGHSMAVRTSTLA